MICRQEVVDLILVQRPSRWGSWQLPVVSYQQKVSCEMADN
jgi:hypothetical protein